jgi:PadR family transcriptional regulator PadR
LTIGREGTLLTLILKTLVREPSHGYRIAQEIKERSEGVLDFKEGTLYPALHKLENEGLVESYEGIEKGRPRRYYRITKAGRGVYRRIRQPRFAPRLANTTNRPSGATSLPMKRIAWP